MYMIQKRFLIGLNDKDLLKQVINTEEAIKKIKQVLFYNGFNYITITEGAGVYVMESNGAQVQEKTIIIDIIESFKDHLKHRKQVLNVIKDLKEVLNQESIGLCISITKASFK